MGTEALRKLQMGFEATKGTKVPATSIWRGQGAIDNQRVVTPVEEDSGYAGPINRVYTPKVYAQLELPATPATFQQLPYVLACGIDGVTTGAADGSGSDKIYAYNFPQQTVRTVKAATWEGGDDTQGYVSEYGICEEFTLSGKGEGTITMESKWFCRQMAKQAFTGALALPAVEDPVFGLTKLYADVIGGNWGTTQLSNVLLDFQLKVVTGFEPVWTGDGQLYYTLESYNKKKFSALLDITFLHTATGVAEWDNYNTNTPRLVSLITKGKAVTTPGTTYSNTSILQNLAGTWISFNKLDRFKGFDIIKGQFRAAQDLTAAKFGNVTVVNELTTLP